MWLFEMLLRIYPTGFRTEYGESMRQAAREELAENGWAIFALRMLWDFLMGWPGVFAEEVAQDLRYAWRSWRRRAVVSGLAVLSLAMAIGVSTGVFSVLEATLYRTLPFRDPESLVGFEEYFSPAPRGKKVYEDWKKEHTFATDLAEFRTSEVNLEAGTRAVRVKAVESTANLFEVLGTPIRQGRGFHPDEEIPGKELVAVISHALWEQALGGDPRVIGKKLTVNRVPVTVIGVAPAGFDYPQRAALWLPTIFDAKRVPKSGVPVSNSIGRLRPGVGMKAAQSALALVWEREKVGSATSRLLMLESKPKLVSLRETLAGPFQNAVWLVFAGVTAVLLIACGNLANLLLSRFGERANEFRIRGWLGADAGRITQQIVTECMLLAMVAGVLGLGFAALTSGIGAYYYPPVLEFQKYRVIEWRVIAFAAGMSGICGVGFALLPVLLRRRAFGAGAERLRLMMLGSQICLCGLLLLGSLSLGKGLLDLYQVDMGFDTAQVETATISLDGQKFDTEAAKSAFWHRSLEEVRRVPGVDKVGLIDFLPLSHQAAFGGMYRVESSKEPVLVVEVSATPGLIDALGVKLLAGRDFEDRDGPQAMPVALVNERLAKLEGGVQKVLGRNLKVTGIEGKVKPGPLVVGVFKDFRQFSPNEDNATPMALLPLRQSVRGFFTVVAKTNRPGVQIGPALSGVDREVPVYDVMAFGKRLDQALARPNFFTLVWVFFGLFSLLLTLIHGYSLCSQTIERRKRELGIRTALGATMGQLRWMIVKQMLPAIAGGFAMAFILSQWMGTPLTYVLSGLQEGPAPWRATVLAGLALGGVLSVWWKTRGVLRMSPAETLRND